MAQGAQRDVNRRREDYMNWGDYFMAVAVLAAKRGKDPRSKVGAAIVNTHKQIVSTGYTTMPPGHDNRELTDEHFYKCHAVSNAILNKNVPDLHDCSIYVGSFPCNECVKMIIQSGIKKVYYLSDKGTDTPKFVAAKRMLDGARVKHMPFQPARNIHEINFEEIDWNNQRT